MNKEESKNESIKYILKAIFAGVYLSLAAYASIIVGTDLPLGLSKLLTGIIFSTGLILIVLTDCYLFTGQMLLITQLKKYVGINGFTIRQILSLWTKIFLYNFIGCLIVVLLLPVVNIDSLIEFKTSLTFWQIVKSGILCNILVCSAVYLAKRADSVVGKIFSVMVPITIFVIAGYEHCVANMFYFLSGICKYEFENYSTLLYLIPATIGNVIGGCLFALSIQKDK